MSNVFLCMKDFGILRSLMEVEKVDQNFHISGISTAVLTEPKHLLELGSDILVMQYDIDKGNAEKLLHYLVDHTEYQHIQVIPLFDEMDADLIAMVHEMGIHTFLVYPFDAKELLNAIQKLSEKQFIRNNNVYNAESFTTYLLLELGLPAHLNGFSYIRTAVQLIVEGTSNKKVIMQNIYDETAQLHNTTAVRVEKCVRTAIRFAYRTHPELVCIHNTKPTGSQIILHVSEQLKLLK